MRRGRVIPLPKPSVGQPRRGRERLYVVKFERIGRTHYVPDVTINASDADGLAGQIHRYAKKFLASKWYEVGLDLKTGRGSIEAGRFGTFRIEDRGAFRQ